MAKKMLIDATHAEETRVVVVDGNKVEEFDFESLNKRQIAGNIYLAKVTRVEPSLQAAFVDYGGNRHGFLAFSEIHVDYYQIPVADREQLIAEERAYAKSLEDDEDEKPVRKPRRRSRRKIDTTAENTPIEDESAAAVEDNVASQDTEAVAQAPEDEAAIDSVVQADGADAAVAPAFDTTRSEDGSEPPVQPNADDQEAPVVAEQATDVAIPDDSVTDDVGSDTDTVDLDSTDASIKPQAMAIDGDDPVVSKDPEAEAAPVASGPELDELPAQDNPGAADIPGMDIVELSEQIEDFAGAPASLEAAKAPAAQKDGIESVADDDTDEDIRPVRKPRPRRYKIQEVIKVRQILLVQVVKEERGNKGAALTTYLSLAGRYCVLMPNTARGGGISRKITNASDRKKLKEIAQSIEVPDGAGLIVRTAGAKRTKAEIKRDYEYLQRLWEQIRDLTLKSIAPAPIYEEGNLIKRSIRDLYNREIDEVLVEGELGYRTAKDFMKMLMPSHAKNVKLHTDGQPLFAKYQVESYLAAMFNPTVQLKSGGYIVIGITEALVAIDVNSGRATKEGSIEETATKTNIEAAEEVARQLRLRDLAGLIVIDFIDMEERKNNAAVEKRFKERLKTDRARIQVGRISGFGLLEMSRQRLRPGMLEATTQPCPVCHGTGLIRSDDSIGLAILRQLEEEGVRKRSREVLLKAPVPIINFLMNTKREHIASIEGRFGLSIRLEADPHLVAPDYTIEKFKTATRVVRELPSSVISIDTESPEDQQIEDAVEVDVVEREDIVSDIAAEEEQPRKKRRRRRRRKSANADESIENAEDLPSAPDDKTEQTEAGVSDEEPAAEEGGEQKKRRRSRRGGRSRRKSEATEDTGTAGISEPDQLTQTQSAATPDPATEPAVVADTHTEPDRVASVPEPDPVAIDPEVSHTEILPDPPTHPAETAAAAPAVPDPVKPKRRGWWSK